MDIARLEEFYEYFSTKLEKSTVSIKVDGIVDEQFSGLPKELIYIWKRYGLSSYGDGIWWHTNPRDFDEIVKSWLKGTPYWEPEINPYHVIGRTAFGELILFGEKTGTNLKIHPLDGMIFPTPSYEKDIKNGKGTIGGLICNFIGGGDKEDFDTYDQNSNHIFDKALKKLGPLKYNEMYTSVPMPVFSGGLTIENVEKEDIFMQLALLRDSIDMPEIMLNPMMDYDE